MVKDYTKKEILEGLKDHSDEVRKAVDRFKSEIQTQKSLNKIANKLIKVKRLWKTGRVNAKKYKF